jgi:putative peptide zinc metalloprotease protein
MAAVKVLHELGHGLSCKHYHGECHELGFMLLVFTPCLYCNVSDSWMLPNKWHRAFIGAAGMYVELTLAAIATFLWWFSDRTGLLSQLCLSVMFICSVSTLVFNGNPLLRFDGYYILMDLAEIPNLRQKSTEVLKRFMVGVCLGLEQPDNPFLPHRNRFFFGMFTVAAVIYRWVVVLSIVMFLNKVFEPYGLKIIGQIIAFAGFFGLVVQPLWALGKFFYMPGRMHKVKRHRVAASLGVVGVIVLAFLFVPFPHAVKCALELSPRDAAAIYVDVPGLLAELHCKEGDEVREGQLLAVLDNPDLRVSVVKLEGRRQLALTRIRTLEEQTRLGEQQASRQIQGVREELATLKEQLREKQEQLDRLRIVVPENVGKKRAEDTGSGEQVQGPQKLAVIPAPPRPHREEEGRLPVWSGSPLDPKNIGAKLTESDMLCRIGDPRDLEAILVIDQADIELVQEARRDGAQPPVTIQLDIFPGHTLKSRVIDVARVEMKSSPVSLSTQAGGQLDTKTDRTTGVQRPLSTSYQALAPLEDTGALRDLLCTGLRGQAKIATRWQSLGKRVYRYLARTFHFEL